VTEAMHAPPVTQHVVDAARLIDRVKKVLPFLDRLWKIAFVRMYSMLADNESMYNPKPMSEAVCASATPAMGSCIDNMNEVGIEKH
jgi:hypothetical protein